MRQKYVVPLTSAGSVSVRASAASPARSSGGSDEAPAEGCHCRCTAVPLTPCAPSAGATMSNAPAPQPAAVVNDETVDVERAAVGQKRSDFATTAQKYVVLGRRLAGVNCVSSMSA